MAAARYWRIIVLATRTADSFAVQLAEIELRATVGGADQTTSGGGSPTASSTNSGSPPESAFDNSGATSWVSLSGSALPQWIRYDFGSAVDVAELAMQAGDTSTRATRAPRTFYLQSSSDDTNWASVAYVPDAAAWSASELRAFSVSSYPVDPGARRYWRVYITSTRTADAYAAGIAEVELRSEIGGADRTSSSHPAAVKTASSYTATFNPYQAFGDDPATSWISASGASLPQWIAYDFVSALGYEVEIVEVGIRAGDNAERATRAPRDFVLQSSSDGSTWAGVVSASDTPAWSTGEVRYFSGGDFEAIVADSGPLGPVRAFAASGSFGFSSAASPLGAFNGLTFHDFTDRLITAGAIEYYVCDLIDGDTTMRVPISSWQGTLQLGSSSYLQAVIPAVLDLADAIQALSVYAEFVIYRGARIPGGQSVEVEMARSIIEQAQLDRGPQRYTCTISGYSGAFVAPAVVYAETDRQLTGVRTISSGSGGTRVRCSIDWLLRPGQTAIAEGAPFEASYINYYVQAREGYMDVGERSA